MRTDCRICHGVALELVLKLAPTPIGDQFLLEPREQPLHPIDLYQCQDCGLAQLLYEIPPEEIYADYIYRTGSSLGLQRHFEQYARRVATICNLMQGEKVVDIGSNDGTLLKEFKKLGASVIGFEPCAEIAQAAKRAGIHTITSYFPDGAKFQTKAKLITANNVVANINDLDAFMQGVVDMLAEDGTFVFESFYLGDVIRNMVFDFIYHEHLSAFSIKPVKLLMRRYGLRLYKVEHLPTKGGSIRYYCNRYYAGRTETEVEDDDGSLYERQTWVDFERRINAERDKTLEFCRKAKAEGKTIAGFGACISGTTLLYHFELGGYVDYLLDDNPGKIGRLSPGLHLQVIGTSEVDKCPPTYVVALAWRFADDFQAAHPNVKVIRPLPCFSIS